MASFWKCHRAFCAHHIWWNGTTQYRHNSFSCHMCTYMKMFYMLDAIGIGIPDAATAFLKMFPCLQLGPVLSSRPDVCPQLAQDSPSILLWRERSDFLVPFWKTGSSTFEDHGGFSENHIKQAWELQKETQKTERQRRNYTNASHNGSVHMHLKFRLSLDR